ncbi:hypothetical protein SODALDRAFT_355898 [Sodiomyces alkalinus F11]|uniref:Uncharacterized protein n=1 Tax=Sodiomyces alkalinus (strain CBS 110278 / VKM F-3762 / F11) TaxID=1314773 RepID=A0A3N2QA76_SODAK|nr:hypothetical protein SODALDRAFT_355898 [Sodiomyces alkalinus F11]ROT43674.1 hypothetical protein SODALDRAFT_355898 [Sodiomyces alkalinus F11]
MDFMLATWQRYLHVRTQRQQLAKPVQAKPIFPKKAYIDGLQMVERPLLHHHTTWFHTTYLSLSRFYIHVHVHIHVHTTILIPSLCPVRSRNQLGFHASPSPVTGRPSGLVGGRNGRIGKTELTLDRSGRIRFEAPVLEKDGSLTPTYLQRCSSNATIKKQKVFPAMSLP